MGMQKLSQNVNKKANLVVRMVSVLLCIIAGITIIAISAANAGKENVQTVQLYSAEINKTMAEKMAFINTVAESVSSGSVSGDMYAYVDRLVEVYDDVSAVYVCVKEDGVIWPDGIRTYMSGGWIPPEDFVVTDRAWYKDAIQLDGVAVSEPYVDEQSGGICITLSQRIYSNGEVIGVAGLDMYMDDLVTLIESSYQGGDYVFLVSGDGTILTHPNTEYALSVENSTNIADALKGRYAKVCEKELSNTMITDYKGGMKFIISSKSEDTGWTVIAVISTSKIMLLIVAIIIISVLFAIIVTKLTQGRLVKLISPLFLPLEDLSANVDNIAEGNLSYEFNIDMQSKEVNELSMALNETMRGLEGYISEINNTVTAISDKNLNVEVEGEFKGEFKKIKDALTSIVSVLNDSFAQINELASTVYEYSSNLSDTSENVADTATTQSQSVLSASEEMKTLNANMEKIAEYANSIKANTDITSESLNRGNVEMAELVNAMNEIAKCYEDIAGFVDEINDIASQTNLLSLNASIEAARAGEVGRGFAVVAGEISNLSDNSARSSAKISEAIARSQQAVNKGMALVERTEKTIEDGVVNSNESAKMVNEIVGFVETQKTSAEEISGNLRDISAMVENNAASAQENSAISQQLGEIAKSLMDTVAEYNLK